MNIDPDVCDVCGTCASVCEYNAIRIQEFKVILDQNKCVQCQNCRKVCPPQAITEE